MTTGWALVFFRRAVLALDVTDRMKAGASTDEVQISFWISNEMLLQCCIDIMANIDPLHRAQEHTAEVKPIPGTEFQHILCRYLRFTTMWVVQKSIFSSPVIGNQKCCLGW